MPERKLTDRIETYISEVNGRCRCGEKVIKVIGSSCTNYADGTRYYYPNDNSAWNIFRCNGCKQPIMDTFEAF